jgi:hypothetical protein
LRPLNIWSQFGELQQEAQFNRMRKPNKRVLVGKTPEEEAARLEREIAAHPVTRCKPVKLNPSSSRPGWSSEPFIRLSEQVIAEGIAQKAALCDLTRKSSGQGLEQAFSSLHAQREACEAAFILRRSTKAGPLLRLVIVA